MWCAMISFLSHVSQNIHIYGVPNLGERSGCRVCKISIGNTARMLVWSASAPNRPWRTFCTKLLPEVQNRQLLPMRFFKHSIPEHNRPASQPACQPASQSNISLDVWQPLSTKMLLKFNIFMNCKSLSGSSAGVMFVCFGILNHI